MLGNWSFGDYFKKEAIAWAWELVVGRWHFPPSRVYATIYSPGPGDPASLDREAHEHWSEIFIQHQLDPRLPRRPRQQEGQLLDDGRHRPLRPVQRTPHRPHARPRATSTSRARSPAATSSITGDARCIEIWNLVFIQFNANPDGTFVDLPSPGTSIPAWASSASPP